jgi:hypothetical protein
MRRTSRIVVLASALAACLPFGAVEPEAGAPDAGGDAQDPDAGTVVTADGGADAAPAFLDQFERDEPAGPWSTHEFGSGVTLAVDTKYAASPTRSLRLTVSPSVTPQAVAGAFLWRPIEATRRRIEIGLSTFFEALPADDVALLTVRFGQSDSQYSYLYLLATEDEIGLLEEAPAGGSSSPAALAGPPMLDTWERRTLIVDLDGKSARLEGPTSATLTLIGEHGPMDRIYLAAAYALAGPTELWIDDVEIR